VEGVAVSLYRCNGIVLRTYKLGESDRIISFITDTHGKVRAVAKGVRKTKSRVGARLEPLSHVSLLLFEGRGDLQTVSQAESIEGFRAIREDLDRLTHASAMIEAVDLMAEEGQPDERLYKMLGGALRSLNENDSPMIVASFFWKLLAHSGYEPLLDECVRCNTTNDLVGFDPIAGGVTCRSCTIGARISVRAYELLHMILGGELRLALAEPVSSATHEVERLATASLEHHLERRLKAGRLLDRG
jgi:DNA repair protein RecO (recombination protein O)